MSDLNDSQSPQNDESDDGLSVLDLAKLPPDQYKVMRVLLREREMSYTALCNHMDALPTHERLSREALNDVLETLIEQHWLLNTGDIYKPNLRRKSNRVLSDFQPPRRKSITIRGLWDSLEQSDNSDEDKP